MHVHIMMNNPGQPLFVVEQENHDKLIDSGCNASEGEWLSLIQANAFGSLSHRPTLSLVELVVYSGNSDGPK